MRKCLGGKRHSRCNTQANCVRIKFVHLVERYCITSSPHCPQTGQNNQSFPLDTEEKHTAGHSPPWVAHGALGVLRWSQQKGERRMRLPEKQKYTHTGQGTRAAHFMAVLLRHDGEATPLAPKGVSDSSTCLPNALYGSHGNVRGRGYTSRATSTHDSRTCCVEHFMTTTQRREVTGPGCAE